MNKKIGKQTIKFENVGVKNAASIVGKKEARGPLGTFFEKTEDDAFFGEKSWEQAESRLQRATFFSLLEKAKLSPGSIDYIVGGDLLNQCTGAGYAQRDINVPFLGVYGACSTMAEAMIIAASFVDGGFGERAVAITSSHFCSAEKQFRFPLEYGGQRPPYAQWTVTGAGAALIEKGQKVKIESATVGKTVDFNVTDQNNMGAAMAPAAADTLKMHLSDTKRSVDDFDLIVTGDLGLVGSRLLIELLKKDGIDISKKHKDCGSMIFDSKRQDTHAGGSGCGCSASVFCAYLFKMLSENENKRILFMPTGALMSPLLILQKESILSIAHAVCLSSYKED